VENKKGGELCISPPKIRLLDFLIAHAQCIFSKSWYQLTAPVYIEKPIIWIRSDLISKSELRMRTCFKPLELKMSASYCTGIFWSISRTFLPSDSEINCHVTPYYGKYSKTLLSQYHWPNISWNSQLAILWMISQTNFACKFNYRYDFINKLQNFRPSKMVTAATKNNNGYIQQNAIMAVVFLRVNILL
jgi:hypothetical protein